MKNFTKKHIISLFFLSIFTFFSHATAYDLTVVGNINHADGLGRISIGVIDLLKDDLEINCISNKPILTDVSDGVKAIALNSDKTPGTVSVLFNPLWHMGNPQYKQTPNSKIKISYSMLESTRIPPEWVEILNNNFDAVAVPDDFLVEVYQTSGVLIPIFVLPLGMYLNDYFQKPKRTRPSTPFVFGSTVSCDERKNYPLLIEAFAEEFGNSDLVILKLNSRFGMVKFCEKLIKSLGMTNIIFTHDVLNNQQYIEFMNSFDCFINLSKGEGFSLCPREALALGIPCILTRNSAQITLCDSGLVREVPSNIPEAATYGKLFGNQQVGNFFTCSKKDVKAALRDVYNNYEAYLKIAQTGPKWVSQYLWIELKPKYLSLIRPKKIILGEENSIADDYLMTNSQTLYNKYKETFNLAD